MKKVAILGSTGSIGVNTIKVVEKYPDLFKVISLSAHSNVSLLTEQIKRLRPKKVALTDPESLGKLKNIDSNTKITDSLDELASDKEVDLVVVAISGLSALKPILAAIRAKKTLALANKEALVAAGPIILKKAAENKVEIRPIDSEHSAIWQCLAGQEKKIKTIYLTASGGPFLNLNISEMKNITPEKALKHPRWKMGKKISIDSATMMNKGLEIIEAMHLFGVSPKQIKVIIHPESIIHSFVEFEDGSVMAQMSNPDMRIAIQYALTYPERKPSDVAPLNLSDIKNLSFFEPDYKKFPALKLAYFAAEKLGTYPCVFNAANEVAVEYFLNNRIKFLDIVKIVEKMLSSHKSIKNPTIDQIFETDLKVRKETEELIKKYYL